MASVFLFLPNARPANRARSVLCYTVTKFLSKFLHFLDYLLHSQYPGTLPLCRALLLVALVKGNCALVVTTKVIKILDLVNSDDPVLTGKGLLNGAELRTLGRQTRVTDAVLCLTRREQRIVVVV